MKRNLGRIMGAALGVSLTVAGCGGLPKSAERQMVQARMALASGDYARCETLLGPVISAHRSNKGTAPAYYMRGQCRLRTAARDAARQDLRNALRLAADDDLRAVVQAQLGNAAFDERAYADAAAHYGQAVDGLPRRSPTDRVLYQYGVALQRTGRFETGRRVFGEVVKQFPSSQYATAARRKQAWREPFFSVQCGVFARQAHARTAAGNLRARGLAALTMPEVREGGRRYVIRVGRFPRYEDAARLLPRVRSAVPDAFIVP